MAYLDLIFLLVLIGGLIAAAIYSKFSRRKTRFDIAEMQYFETAIHAKNSKYSFDPKTATVIRKDIDQTNGESTTYAVTIYAQNESGEYFVYRSDGVKPSVKHLEHGIAKIVLKSQYISPHETD